MSQLAHDCFPTVQSSSTFVQGKSCERRLPKSPVVSIGRGRTPPPTNERKGAPPALPLDTSVILIPGGTPIRYKRKGKRRKLHFEKTNPIGPARGSCKNEPNCPARAFVTLFVQNEPNRVAFERFRLMCKTKPIAPARGLYKTNPTAPR
jgi:hypothetical protein